MILIMLTWAEAMGVIDDKVILNMDKNKPLKLVYSTKIVDLSKFFLNPVT